MMPDRGAMIAHDGSRSAIPIRATIAQNFAATPKRRARRRGPDRMVKKFLPPCESYSRARRSACSSFFLCWSQRACSASARASSAARSASIASALAPCSRRALSNAASAAVTALSRRARSLARAASSLARATSRRRSSFSKAAAALRTAASSIARLAFRAVLAGRFCAPDLRFDLLLGLASPSPRSVGSSALSVNGPSEPTGRLSTTPGFAMVAATTSGSSVSFAAPWWNRLELAPQASSAAFIEGAAIAWSKKPSEVW
nr:hypothetical protein BDOA9_0142040 [Bradyrhizobium sp. DOA9]